MQIPIFSFVFFLNLKYQSLFLLLGLLPTGNEDNALCSSVDEKRKYCKQITWSDKQDDGGKRLSIMLF